MCQLLADPFAAVITDMDKSFTGPYGRCESVPVLEDVAKAGYWLWKTWGWLGEL